MFHFEHDSEVHTATLPLPVSVAGGLWTSGPPFLLGYWIHIIRKLWKTSAVYKVLPHHPLKSLTNAQHIILLLSNILIWMRVGWNYFKGNIVAIIYLCIYQSCPKFVFSSLQPRAHLIGHRFTSSNIHNQLAPPNCCKYFSNFCHRCTQASLELFTTNDISYCCVTCYCVTQKI